MVTVTSVPRKEKSSNSHPFERDSIRQVAYNTVKKLHLSGQQAEALRRVLDKVLICK